MMIAAFDVQYSGKGYASAAAVMFSNYSDAKPASTFIGLMPEPADYRSGEFYRRELPCLLKLLEDIKETPSEIIIDGYVMLGDKPGLGQHLFESLAGRVPVVGVAKSKYRGSHGVEIIRGRSLKPLYVTSAGVKLLETAEKISKKRDDLKI
jgi:deoxyribonuclease V